MLCLEIVTHYKDSKSFAICKLFAKNKAEISFEIPTFEV